jgi:hypothetical protein
MEWKKEDNMTKQTQTIQPLLNWVTCSILNAGGTPQKRNEPKLQNKAKNRVAPSSNSLRVAFTKRTQTCLSTLVSRLWTHFVQTNPFSKPPRQL